jgi:hypothetical protein
MDGFRKVLLSIALVFTAALVAVMTPSGAKAHLGTGGLFGETALAEESPSTQAAVNANQSGAAVPTPAPEPAPAPAAASVPDPAPVPLLVDHWELVAVFGAAGPQRLPVADGYIFANCGGITALRVTLTKPVDPTTLNAGSVTLIGQLHGNLGELIKSITLEDGGKTVLITLFDTLPDVDRYSIILGSDIRDLDGLPLVGKNSLNMALLAGDVDSTGTVTPNDVAEVRKHLGESFSPSNYRYDIDSSGRVDEGDLSALKNLLGHTLP